MDFCDDVGVLYAAGEEDVGGAFADVGVGGVDEGAEDVDGDCWEECQFAERWMD